MNDSHDIPRNTTEPPHSTYLIPCPECDTEVAMPSDAYEETGLTCALGHTFTKRQYLDSLDYWN